MEGDHVCQGRASGGDASSLCTGKSWRDVSGRLLPSRSLVLPGCERLRATFCESTCDLLDELPHLRVSGKTERLGSGKGSGQSSDTGISVWLSLSPVLTHGVPRFSLPRPPCSRNTEESHAHCSEHFNLLFLLPRPRAIYTLSLTSRLVGEWGPQHPGRHGPTGVSGSETP